MAQIINPTIRIIFVILIIIFAGLLQTASASGDDIFELRERIFSFDDPRITVKDLAFFLLTHNFDAKPMGDYVELNLNGAIYRLIPNGDKPGLCDISPALP
ncbi:MAG: hypothetical protein PHN61_14190 [Methanothrix sp.]|nr:hypothetical protein [Methanothrix sp.]